MGKNLCHIIYYEGLLFRIHKKLKKKSKKANDPLEEWAWNLKRMFSKEEKNG